MGTIWFLVESQFQTAGSELVGAAREGRIRTQTTTFCLDSEVVVVDEDATSAGLEGDVMGVADGVDSSSATDARLDSALVEGVEADSSDTLSDDVLGSFAGPVEAETGFVKGEDLAAEPTLAFLAMAAARELRCSEVVWTMVERRLARVGEG